MININNYQNFSNLHNLMKETDIKGSEQQKGSNIIEEKDNMLSKKEFSDKFFYKDNFAWRDKFIKHYNDLPECTEKQELREFLNTIFKETKSILFAEDTKESDFMKNILKESFRNKAIETLIDNAIDNDPNSGGIITDIPSRSDQARTLEDLVSREIPEGKVLVLLRSFESKSSEDIENDISSHKDVYTLKYAYIDKEKVGIKNDQVKKSNVWTMDTERYYFYGAMPADVFSDIDDMATSHKVKTLNSFTQNFNEEPTTTTANAKIHFGHDKTNILENNTELTDVKTIIDKSPPGVLRLEMSAETSETGSVKYNQEVAAGRMKNTILALAKRLNLPAKDQVSIEMTDHTVKKFTFAELGNMSNKDFLDLTANSPKKTIFFSYINNKPIMIKMSVLGEKRAKLDHKSAANERVVNITYPGKNEQPIKKNTNQHFSFQETCLVITNTASKGTIPVKTKPKPQARDQFSIFDRDKKDREIPIYEITYGTPEVLNTPENIDT